MNVIDKFEKGVDRPNPVATSQSSVADAAFTVDIVRSLDFFDYIRILVWAESPANQIELCTSSAFGSAERIC